VLLWWCSCDPSSVRRVCVARTVCRRCRASWRKLTSCCTMDCAFGQNIRATTNQTNVRQRRQHLQSRLLCDQLSTSCSNMYRRMCCRSLATMLLGLMWFTLKFVVRAVHNRCRCTNDSQTRVQCRFTVRAAHNRWRSMYLQRWTNSDLSTRVRRPTLRRPAIRMCPRSVPCSCRPIISVPYVWIIHTHIHVSERRFTFHMHSKCPHQCRRSRSQIIAVISSIKLHKGCTLRDNSHSLWSTTTRPATHQPCQA